MAVGRLRGQLWRHVALAALLAACGGGGGAGHPQAIRPAAAPGCSDAVAAANASSSSVAQLQLDGAPFGVAASTDSHIVFVALNGTDASDPGAVAAVDVASGAAVGSVAVPGSDTRSLLGGAAITHDGRLVLVAIGDGIAVFDADRIRSSAAGARLGTLHAAKEAGTIHVAVSPDDHYVAATEEAGAAVTVFDLRAAEADGFAHDSGVGSVRVNPAPVGVAFTRDGGSLLVTSQTSGSLSS